MSLKVLGGIAKGQELFLPPSSITRPMNTLLKRRIFDSYHHLDDVIFVDLCGGSGAVGIEAWSRGAGSVYINEKSNRVYPVLKKNILKIKKGYPGQEIDRPIKTKQSDCLHFLKDFRSTYLSFDEEKMENTLIFLAPPYSMHEVYENTLSYLSKSKWFKGQIWVESDLHKGPNAQQINDWSRRSVKSITQGSTFLEVINY